MTLGTRRRRVGFIARLALKNAWADRAGLAMCGVAIVLAVAFATATRALTAGVAAQLRVDVSSAYEGVDAVVRYPETGRISDGAATNAIPLRKAVPSSAVASVASVPGVADAGANLVLPVQLSTLDNRLLGHPAPERNLGFAWLGDTPMNPLHVVEGSPPRLPNEVVVDSATAGREGIHPGDAVKVVTPGGTFTVTVSGLVSYGTASGLNSRAVVAFSPTLLSLAGEQGSATEVLVRFDRGAERAAVFSALRAAVTDDGFEVVEGTVWRHEQAAILAAPLEAAAFFLTFFTYTTVGVAAILIANTFLVVMQRRTREVALLRLVGMSRRAITWTLVLEALLVGLLFALPGAAVGLFAANIVADRLRGLGTDLPPLADLVNLNVLGMPLASGVLVTVLSSVAPARRTAATPPIAALGESTVAPRALNDRRRQRAVAPLLGGVASVAWGVGRGVPVAFAVGIAYLVVALALAGPSLVSAAADRLGRLLPSQRSVIVRLAASSPRRHPERSFATAAALMVGVGIFSFFAVFVATASSSASRVAAESLNGEVIVTGTGVSVANLPVTVPESLRTSGRFRAISAITSARASDADSRLGGRELSVGGVDEPFFSLWSSGAPNDAWSQLSAARPDGQIPMLVVRDDAGSLSVGETMRVGFNSGIVTFRVIGFVERGLPGFSAPSLLIDGRVLGRLAPAPVGFVLVDGTGTPDVVRDAVRSVLADEPTAVVRTAKEFQGVGGAEMEQLLAVARLLLAMAVVLAVLGVTNTMVLTVRERRREMALLRAVGTQRRALLGLVVLEGEVLAAIGAVSGVVIGTSIAAGMVWSVPTGSLRTPAVPWSVLAIGGVVALVAVGLSTVVPAIRAARSPVLEGLQHS